MTDKSNTIIDLDSTAYSSLTDDHHGLEATGVLAGVEPDTEADDAGLSPPGLEPSALSFDGSSQSVLQPIGQVSTNSLIDNDLLARTIGSPADAGVVNAAASPAAPLPNATLGELADYLQYGYWSDVGSRPGHSYNMGATGTGANNGIIYYDYDGFSGVSGPVNDSNGLSTAQRTLVDTALAYYSEILGITFIHSSSPPSGGVDLYFGNADTSGNYANYSLYSSGLNANHRYVDYAWVNLTASSTSINSGAYETTLHEIGHVLGLGHMGPYNGSVNFVTDTTDPNFGSNSNIFLNDSELVSMMSYISVQTNTTVDGTFTNQLTPMQADQITLQRYYGNSAFAGNTTYGFNTNITTTTFANLSTFSSTMGFCITDSGGTDTLDFSGFADDQIINLTVTSQSSSATFASSIGGETNNMTIAVGTVIERAIGGSGDDQLLGNQFANILTGNAGADTIKGGGGNDTLYGGAGADELSGEDGNDFIYGSTGVDGSGDTSANSLFGGDGDDSLRGGDGADDLYGGDGNDELRGNAGNDTLDGGAGIDEADYFYATSAVTVNLATGTATGGDGTDTLSNIEGIGGSGFADTLTGNGGANTIFGQSGNDNIYGGAGGDTLYGGNDDDQINGGGGGDLLYGGSGDDTLFRSSGSSLQNAYYGGSGFDVINTDGSNFNNNVVFDMAAGFMTLSGSNYEIWNGFEHYDGSAGTGQEDVDGTSAANWILLGSGNNQADGGAGDDVLKGGGGADTLLGNDGDDSVLGEDGDDTLYGMNGDDTINGGNGNDFMKGGGGADSFTGGAGVDTVNYSDSGAGISIDLDAGTGSGGTAEGDTFNGVENVDGTGFGDVIGGNASANELSGFNGADILSGGDGNDTLDGGNDDDTLKGGGGNDALIGGAGIDTASYIEATGAVTVNLLTGLASGADGNDTLSSIEIVHGSGYDDVFYSSNATAQTFYGNNGNDTFYKQEGTNPAWLHTFSGGNGIDTLVATGLNSFIDIDLEAGFIITSGNNRDTLESIENVTVDDDVDVYGNNVANVLIASGAHSQELSGRGGNDTIDAGAGNDTVEGGAGADTMDGGDGDDLLSYASSGSGVRVNMGTGAGLLGDAAGDSFTNFERLLGSAHNDVLFGDFAANGIQGGDGDDIIRGGNGADIMDGGAGTGDMLSYAGSSAAVTVNLGTNTVSGGHATGDVISNFEKVYGSNFGDDLTGSAGDDQLSGGKGNDLFLGGAGADAIYGGGGGADTMSYVGSAAGVSIDLANKTASGGDATGDVFAGIERVIGTDFDDVLLGSAANNQLQGGLGDDIIRGGAGADNLFGGTGGSDTVSYAGSNAGVTIDIQANTAAGGHATGDLISGFENVFGSGFADVLVGNVDANQLDGSGGNDQLFGFGGNDVLIGGAGNDRIDGGGGHDTKTGGAGSDVFVLGWFASGSDIITDFNVAADQLEVSAADFGGGLTAGALAASQFVVNATGIAGDADDRFIFNNVTGDLFFDINGSGAGGNRLIATFSPLIPALTASDFDIV